MRMLPLALLAALVPACSSDSGISGDAMADMTPATNVTPPDLATAPFPAKQPDAPQVVASGGPVLASPRFVPVLFAADDPQAKMQIEDFTAKVGATSYWTATTKEYGVGAATATPPVELAETAAANPTDDDIQRWLAAKLNAGDPALPVADKDTLYVIYYPAGTTVSLPQGGGAALSCVDFGGYHSNLALDGNHNNMPVAYAVIPRCTDFGGLTGIDSITGTASHELVEAATDPYPQDAPAYGFVDDNHAYWAYALGGGEVADMCAQFYEMFLQFPELPYVVQRSWSNAAAVAGHDPCVPDRPSEIYFNSAPELPDAVASRGGTVPGVNVPAGTSKTIAVDLFSDADTHDDWTVYAVDYAKLTGGKAGLAFTWDRTTGHNGDQLHLTITTLATSTRAHATFIIVSKLGVHENWWFGEVGE